MLILEFRVNSPKVNLRLPRGQPRSNFHILVQNLMGVLTTKFHSYPINNSQVISFPTSIITFSGKGLLTLKGVAGRFSLTRGLFWRSYRWCFSECKWPPIQPVDLVQTILQDVFCQYLSSPQISAPCTHLRSKNDFSKIGVGLFTYVIKPEVGVLGFWGSQFKLPLTRPTTY